VGRNTSTYSYVARLLYSSSPVTTMIQFTHANCFCNWTIKIPNYTANSRYSASIMLKSSLKHQPLSLTVQITGTAIFASVVQISTHASN
jgi:hypothetical protein